MSNKGLNSDEVKELINYINEKNSYVDLYNNVHIEKRPVPKYVNISMDTRDGSVWLIEFRDVVSEAKYPNEVMFRTEQNYNLKDMIYKFLDGKLTILEMRHYGIILPNK